MRFKAFGMGAAGILAAGTFAVVGGVHQTSVFASCTGTAVNPNPAATASAEVDSPVGCLQAGASTNGGVVYNPVSGSATSGLPGVYVVAQGNGALGCLPAPIGCALGGYVGVSNFEGGGAASGTAGPNDPPCNPSGNGAPSDTNGGGSVGLDQLTTAGGNPEPGVVREDCSGQVFVANVPTVFLVAPVACGNVSGQNFFGTSRDGCWEP